jgi:NDP-sugar pyrophosphorylase family protein
MVIRHLNVKVPFGVIESQGSKLTSIKEKPSLDVMINAGIYVINKEVLKTVNEEYINMTDIFSSLLDKRKSVHCYPLVESWTDIGHPDDLNSAQSQF